MDTEKLAHYVYAPKNRWTNFLYLFCCNALQVQLNLNQAEK